MLAFAFMALAALPLPPETNPDLFPGADQYSAAEVELAGMMALYPGHILHGPPRDNDPANTTRPPKMAQLPREVYYLRIYDLGASLTQIAQCLNQQLVILDFRYVTADAAASEAFAGLLAKAGLASAPVHGIGSIKEPEPLPPAKAEDKDHPPPVVLALVNGQTSGPLEAWLEAFQEKESVLAVGAPTAGQPGKYDKYDGQPGYFIITGELRPESGSLTGVGLKPRFLVDVTPQQNDVAYFTVERGTVDVSTMLRRERTTTTAAPAATGNTTTAPATQSVTVTTEASDLVLQRAVDVVAALQVLGRVPASKDAGAAKPAGTPSATP